MPMALRYTMYLVCQFLMKAPGNTQEICVRVRARVRHNKLKLRNDVISSLPVTSILPPKNYLKTKVKFCPCQSLITRCDMYTCVAFISDRDAVRSDM